MKVACLRSDPSWTTLLQLLNLEEFTELLNECAPDVILWYSFTILCSLASASSDAASSKDNSSLRVQLL